MTKFYLHRSGEMVYRLWRGQIYFKYLTWPKSQPWAESSVQAIKPEYGFVEITKEKVKELWPTKKKN